MSKEDKLVDNAVLVDGIEVGVHELLKAYRESARFLKDQLTEISKGLAQGVSANLYAKENLSAGTMRELRKLLSLHKKADVEHILHTVLSITEDQEEIKEVRLGVESGVDVTHYIEGFNSQQMEQIRLGLESKVDVQIYAESPSIFNEWQMEQIRLGLESKLDVSCYDKSEYGRQRMHHIREGLEMGLDIQVLLNESIPEWKFFYIMHEYKKSNPVLEFVLNKNVESALDYFSLHRATGGRSESVKTALGLLDQGVKAVIIEQLMLIEDMNSMPAFIDTFILGNKYKADQIAEIVKGSNSGLDMLSNPISEEYSAAQIYAIRRREVEGNGIDRGLLTPDLAWENILLANE